MLLTRFDLKVVAGRNKIVGIFDLNFVSQRDVAVHVSIWIWLDVW